MCVTGRPAVGSAAFLWEVVWGQGAEFAQPWRGSEFWRYVPFLLTLLNSMADMRIGGELLSLLLEQAWEEPGGSLCSSAPILRGLARVGSADDKKEGTPTATRKRSGERSPACAQGQSGMEQQGHSGGWLCFLLAPGLSQKALGHGRVGDVPPH